MSKTGLLFSAAVFTFALCTYAAQNPSQRRSPVPSPDRIDDAHDLLLAPKTVTAEEKARLTNEAAKGLPDAGKAEARIPRKNFIDESIFSRIERDKIPHANLSSDDEFVRRVYVDATGVLPTAQQVRDFVASKDANKRDTLIDS